jgi:hypothetical protein
MSGSGRSREEKKDLVWLPSMASSSPHQWQLFVVMLPKLKSHIVIEDRYLRLSICSQYG